MRKVMKGDLVEYTDDWYLDYPPKTSDGREDWTDVKWGVAVRDQDKNGVMVERADGVIEIAKEVHSYAWFGWIPEGLEEVMAKYEWQGPDWEPEHPE